MLTITRSFFAFHYRPIVAHASLYRSLTVGIVDAAASCIAWHPSSCKVVAESQGSGSGGIIADYNTN